MESNDIKVLQNKMLSLKINLIINNIITILLVLAMIMLAISSHTTPLRKNRSATQRLTELTNAILDSCCQVEDCGNMIIAVWNNSIYNKEAANTDMYTREDNGTGAFYEDFNDALDNLFLDPEFAGQIDAIRLQQQNIIALMREMNDLQENNQEVYDDLKNYYECYMQFADMVVHPTGSLSSFSSDFDEADENTVRYYRNIILYTE
ncbi:MAG: hypothetical protein IJ833_04925 [Lachnospiraceae bacterium]|nr:hypothetical protein [Lachnospiraceae bacterium]